MPHLPHQPAPPHDNRSGRLVVLPALLALAGCAGLPRVDPVAGDVDPGDCSVLTAELDRTLEAREAALQARRNSWKLVLPVAAAARYAHAANRVRDYEERIATLESWLASAGCTRAAAMEEGS
jgi:hypothetical protein